MVIFSLKMVRFGCCKLISKTTEDRVVKLLHTSIVHQVLAFGRQTTPYKRGVLKGHVTCIFNFDSPVTCVELVKLGTLHFLCYSYCRVKINAIADYPWKGCVRGHVTFLSFGKCVIISQKRCKIETVTT